MRLARKRANVLHCSKTLRTFLCMRRTLNSVNAGIRLLIHLGYRLSEGQKPGKDILLQQAFFNVYVRLKPLFKQP
ncbi:hypothetical protein BZ160_16295 [Pantoea vagans]|nr:hypothetical protein BZ160_16295 [Pantoea vagans]